MCQLNSPPFALNDFLPESIFHFADSLGHCRLGQAHSLTNSGHADSLVEESQDEEIINIQQA